MLPIELRDRIKYLFGLKKSNEEVFSLVFDEGKDYVKSDDQLRRCIISLKGKVDKESKSKTGIKPPEPKTFDDTPHRKIISKLYGGMPGKELEDACTDIVLDILENYEGFNSVMQGPPFRGTPFDFFGFKDDAPYIIEFKGSLNSFHHPGETQKRRMRELMDRIDGLNVALIQIRVKVKEKQYRIFYNEQLDILFHGRKMPIRQIEKWIMDRM